MYWGWLISKKDLLERQYNLSKEIESLNKEIEILEGRISELENKGAKKKPGKKPVQKKTEKKAEKLSKIYFQRKTEKGLDNFIAQKIKEGYLLLTKKEKDGTWTASMEKAK
jgi:chromosome segregation ATPase